MSENMEIAVELAEKSDAAGRLPPAASRTK
jgi:hypothetical protein